MQPTIILKRRVAGLSQRSLAEYVSVACRAVRLRGTASILLTGDREMRSLNRRFRGKDKATDVLSFPAPEFVNGFAGDIAISLDVASRNAKELGHSLNEEVRILVLHGLLHLAGYDHESDGGKMAEKERRLRSRLALPAALIERSHAPITNSRVRMRSSRT